MKYLCLLFLASVLVSCGSSRKSAYTPSRKSTSSVRVSTSKVVNDARTLVRKPYRYGGESPNGFDCSGFVKYVYAKHGVQLPRRSADQARYGKSVAIREARPGDLIFFKSSGRVNHVGIVTATGGKFPSMIHSSSSKGVIEEDLDTSEYWRKRYAYIRRL